MSPPWCRAVCVYLVLQLIIGIIIENIETLEKMENMKVSQKHVQVLMPCLANLCVFMMIMFLLDFSSRDIIPIL